MSSAGIHNLLCDQGATFRKTLTMLASDGTTAIDLTGFTARMKIKDEVGGTLIKSLSSSSGGGLTIGGASGQTTNGEIDILISASDTASFSAPLDAVYDLEIESNTGVVDRVLQGKFIINPEVTD